MNTRFTQIRLLVRTRVGSPRPADSPTNCLLEKLSQARLVSNGDRDQGGDGHVGPPSLNPLKVLRVDTDPLGCGFQAQIQVVPDPA